jgi:cytosine/adenosine deaminase-related metal-dependent hydrolase
MKLSVCSSTGSGHCLSQDRDHTGRRTPRWRGITALAELAAGGVAVALASDNTRDQFYAYGDLDMLEVFAQVSDAHSCAASRKFDLCLRRRCC